MRSRELVITIITLILSSSVNAQLVSRLGGLANYDDEVNITWLADANYAATETFGLDSQYRYADNGSMQWELAVGYAGRTGSGTWIGLLNSSNYLGFNGWRLPSTKQPDDTCSSSILEGSSGFNCTGSELGHLFYEELGGVAGEPLSQQRNNFYNIPDGAFNYWTSLQSPDASTSLNVWTFSTIGYQHTSSKGSYAFVWAVADGDPFAPVPIPATAWLLVSGIIGLLVVAKRRTRTQPNAI